MRILKIITLVMLGLCILALLVVIGGYLYYNNKYPVDAEKYPNYVGYIDQETAALNKNDTLCNAEAIYYVHHGASEKGYAGNKKQFREFILANFKSKAFTDSGYLNFRFLVSCNGNPGWFKTIQVDTTYNTTQFSEALVSQLRTLTAKPDNWNILRIEESPVDYYMYVSYKLQDGKIIEILP
ncbi:hypothetical protein [Aequorivita marina]|uniref:hypothetical protein n=1 Tax=Aequorivita marina TaxID=3073654 RepID=UPI0028752C3D|nr:hypothetical protein [Aequorivita sp. S2608]MDS1297380.1 hypothetical protein [Aequorivita sp. S2608]